MPRCQCFALLTDFGTRDGYVGALKAVISGLVPGAHIIDLCHDVTPQDVQHGAELLLDLKPFLPRASMVVAVVDPGVGTDRRGLAVEWLDEQRWMVGPDNGLLWPAMQGDRVRVHQLDNPEYRLPLVASTFHGRDVFAPAAAHLALGVPIERFGPAVSDPQSLALPQPLVGPQQIAGQILRADHYGNLISNISQRLLPAGVTPDRLHLQMGDIEVHGLMTSYGHAAPGGLLATIGGFGRIELAINGGSAARALGYSAEASFPLTVSWSS